MKSKELPPPPPPKATEGPARWTTLGKAAFPRKQQRVTVGLLLPQSSRARDWGQKPQAHIQDSKVRSGPGFRLQSIASWADVQHTL